MSIPETPRYVTPAPTKEKLDYADLAIIDLSEAATAEGRAALSAKVRGAMTSQGFFYVINHGYTAAQTERIFDIANIPFDHVSESEKSEYVAKMKENGSYQGYKPRNYWHIAGGVRDQLEHYNLNRDVTVRAHPKPLRPFLPEIEQFAWHNHFNVLHPILRLLAKGLDLPEETLVNLHGYSSIGETYVRFMKYYPRSQEEESKTNNVWLKGHTDFGTITILYSQPVAALQILSPESKWRWIRHIDNALVINAGDALEFVSGGIYAGTRHRVVRPPIDQQEHTRLGVFYFCMTDDNVRLAPLVKTNTNGQGKDKSQAPTMEEWRRARTSAYGQSDLKPRQDGSGVEEELINGVVVKHFN